VKLFGDLVGQFDGPILVIGGGPSAARDLPVLRELVDRGEYPEPVAVLSANEHGHRQTLFPVTHSVCCDGRHGEKRISMETLLRTFGEQPIISPCHFGTYRLPEWKLAANTGLTAVVVAVYMGAAPAVVTGLDFYRLRDKRAGTYFHDAAAVSNSNAKKPENFMSQVEAVERAIGKRPAVRALSGLIAERWGFFDARIRFAAQPVLPDARYMRALPTLIVQARPHPAVQFKAWTVEPGRLFPVSPNEARGPINSRACKLIETHPAPGETTFTLPPELTRAPRQYRPVIAKKHLVGRA
jgi:hypothetical protein